MLLGYPAKPIELQFAVSIQCNFPGLELDMLCNDLFGLISDRVRPWSYKCCKESDSESYGMPCEPDADMLRTRCAFRNHLGAIDDPGAAHANL